MDYKVITTKDQHPALKDLVLKLPGILAGNVQDAFGIANGFRVRIGYAILSLIAPNFNELGRGFSGANGEKWPPLSKEYLAYGRRFGPTEMSDLKKQHGLGKQHRFAPGNKKGLLTADQLKMWRSIYADRLAWYEMQLPDKKAKEVAARIAWAAVKKAGGKTKLEVYGNRVVQILVDTGRLRASLQPGLVFDSGPGAAYQKPTGEGGTDQAFEPKPSEVVVGTNVKYGAYHHEGRKVPQRRLWPAEFPPTWWQQILGVAISGLVRIGDLFNGSKPL
jgi:hypothetical protein